MIPRIAFNAPGYQPGTQLNPTLGVEWELATVDPVTGELVPRAAEVIQLVQQRHPEIHLEREFLANSIEVVTGVCHTVPEAMSEIRHARAALLDAAEEVGVELYAAGSHPTALGLEQDVSNKQNYNEIIERTQYWGRQMIIWGVHVHVAIADESFVWPVINALYTLQPHLLAISASSPAYEGRDTGYASNRTMLYQQLPTAGISPQFSTWAEYEQYHYEQKRSGVISHTGSMHFDIRPAPGWGTVELRVCDTVATMAELEAMVAFMHCSTTYFERKLAAGEQLPSLQPWHVAENKWRAARYGLDALVICNRATDEALVTDEIRRWVSILEPVAHDLGCHRELLSLLTLLDRPGAYQRQRAAAQADDWKAAIATTVAELKSGE